MGNKIDLIGQRFGKWMVLKEAGRTKRGLTTWLCKCDCGNEGIVIGSSLTRKTRSSKSCTNCGFKMSAGTKRIDLIGHRFGKLEVLEFAYVKNDKTHWLCKCDCGNEVIVSNSELRRKRSFTGGRWKDGTKSCGCLQIEAAKETLELIDTKGDKNPAWKGGITFVPGYSDVVCAKRRAKKKNQTPLLTENEKNKIALYYQICKSMGPGWHVDHIRPISKGGLHHPDNLQILTKEANLRKSNKLDYKLKSTDYFRL